MLKPQHPKNFCSAWSICAGGLQTQALLIAFLCPLLVNGSVTGEPPSLGAVSPRGPMQPPCPDLQLPFLLAAAAWGGLAAAPGRSLGDTSLAMSPLQLRLPRHPCSTWLLQASAQPPSSQPCCRWASWITPQWRSQTDSTDLYAF